MQLFIPACGDRLTLIEPWSFDLYLERRNLAFAKMIGIIEKEKMTAHLIWEGDPYRSALKKKQVTLSAGDTIECDRVYIRTFSKSAIMKDQDYDSITWKLMRKGKKAFHGRFWVKLPDVYNIHYTLEETSLYRDRVKLVKSVHAQ